MTATDFAELDGVRLRYRLTGEGRRTLVLIHELGGSLESWDGVLAALGDGVRALAYDQRGAGGSQTPAHAFGLDEQVADLAAVLDRLGIDTPVVLVSCAAAAGVAARFAVAHWQRTAGLLLCGPIVNAPESSRATGRERAASVRAGGMQAVAHALERSYPQGVIRDQAVFEAYRDRFLAIDPEGYAGNLLAFGSAAPIDLAKVAAPARVIAADHDFMPLAVMQDVADALGARLVRIDAGHFMHVQAPAAVAAELRGFLDELS